MSNVLVEESNLQNIANAIRTKNGSSDTYLPSQMSSAILDIPSGGGGITPQPMKDVNFIDYDGTIVKSYTASEFANVTVLPDNPEHDGLTAQGWNWTLADAKTYVASYGELTIGQMYTTSDGKTRLYIDVPEGRLSPQLGVCIKGTCVIDWGDNTATTTLTGTSTSIIKWSSAHTYAQKGKYVVTLTVTGSLYIKGSNYTDEWGAIFRASSGTDSANNGYRAVLKKVEIGNNIKSIGDYAFSHCYSLTSITIPNTLTTFGNRCFEDCYCLQAITVPTSISSLYMYFCYNNYNLILASLPRSITQFGDYIFSLCYKLQKAQIPNSNITLGSHMFSYCYNLNSVKIPNTIATLKSGLVEYCVSLSYIVIPNSVTKIEGLLCRGCTFLSYIKFTSSTPPTVSASSAWTNVPTDCIIYVPSGSLSAYTSASYYPSSSTYTYVEY